MEYFFDCNNTYDFEFTYGAISGGIRGGIAYKNTTPLFRAMTQGEANSIARSGNLETKLGQAEGKYLKQ